MIVTKHILLLAATLVAGCAAWGQSKTYTSSKGSVEIIGDTGITRLVEKHIELNERVKTVSGYRIQIGSLAGNDAKSRAFDRKEKFTQAYPDVPIYIIYDEPNFRVKVGDFINRLDAYAFLQKIKANFPGSIVRDNVYPIHQTLEELIPESEDDI
ncbi:MAG: SPOR domain-containing protein [Bacteroidales bacterium]|nr:SPOR domain-containing protein [Bacteroidales bacterium]